MKLLIDIFSDKIIVKKDGSSKLENRLNFIKVIKLLKSEPSVIYHEIYHYSNRGAAADKS